MKPVKAKKKPISLLWFIIPGFCLILLFGKNFFSGPDLEELDSGQNHEKPGPKVSLFDVSEAEYAEYYDLPVPSVVEESSWGNDFDAGKGRDDAHRPSTRPDVTVQVPYDAVVDELGQRFRESTDPEQRRLAFNDLMDTLTVDNARAIRAQIAHLSPESHEYSMFHYKWGEIGGSEAVMHGAQTKKPDMGITLAGWASANPDAAMDWFESLPKYDRKNYANQAYMMRGLVHGLADSDPQRAVDFVYNLKKAGNRQTGRMMSVVASRKIHAEGVENTAAWTDSLPPGEMRDAARARVVWDLGKEDLGTAATWVEGFSHEKDAGLAVEAMAKVWASQDILGSVTWLESLEASGAKRKGLSAAYGYWGALEPESAGEYLNQLPVSPDRDFAINGFISGMVHKDPETAVIWAEEISNKGLREAAMVRAGHNFFRQSREAASDWLKGTALPEKAVQQLINQGKNHEGRGK